MHPAPPHPPANILVAGSASDLESVQVIDCALDHPGGPDIMASRDRNPVKGATRPPSALQNAGTKRKERDYERDTGDETNINVVVRCRGRSDREVRENSGVVVSTSGVRGKSVELCMGPNAISNKTYHFDKVFSSAADQTIIFEDVVAPILNEMLSGYNCTIFAYGQTGTGKTYTMSGDMTDTLGLLSDAAGIIPRVLYSLFQKLESEGTECSVKCSFIELYNEDLRDLLSADENVKLKIYDDSSKKNHSATVVQGMEETHIKSAAEGIKRLQEGSHRRQVAATNCNDLSSRSHTVFTITTYTKKLNESSEDYICSGKLNLVDLAGSENIQRSGAENKRAAEAGLINKSLLTLGRVINALVDKSAHIPYRESKLTRLLQDSLGGRTKTCIIATVSPAKSNLEETISTLDYAFRAKNIRNKPQVNSMISKKTLLREFTAEIEKLKSELIATRQRNGVYLTNEQFEEITVESESRKILSEEQKARIETIENNLRKKVEELFILTNKFGQLKKDNEATRTALEGTKDVLIKTELVLNDAKQNLEEETKLRKAHAATEGELRGIGKELILTIGDSVHDLDRLHSKLRRRSDLHYRNQEFWSASMSQVLDVSQAVDNRLDQLQRQHNMLLKNLSSRIDDFVNGEVQRALRGATAVQSCSMALVNRTQDIERKSCDAQDEMSEVLEEIKVLREEVKAEVGEGLHGMSEAAARIAGEVISELEQFHTQLHASYSGLGKDFKQLFDETSSQLAAQRTESDRLRKELEKANVQKLEASLAASSKLEACIEAERAAADEEREELMQQISVLVRASNTKREERFSRAILDTKSEIVRSAEEFEVAHQEYKDGMARWATQDTALMDRVNKSKEELKTKMKQDWTAVEARTTAIQASTRAVHGETVKIVDAQLETMATQMAALDDFVTKARQQNDSNYDEQTLRLREMSNHLSTAFTDLASAFADDQAQSFNTEMQSQTTSVSNDLKPLIEDIRRPLQTLTSHFTTTSLQNYAPTGETPAKKAWVYPTELPRTSTGQTPPSSDLTMSTTAPSNKTPSRLQSKSKSPRKLASPRKMLVKEVYVDSPPSIAPSNIFIPDTQLPPPPPLPPASITRTESTKSLPTNTSSLKEIGINTAPNSTRTMSSPTSNTASKPSITTTAEDHNASTTQPNFKSRVPQLRVTRSTAGKNALLSVSIGPGTTISGNTGTAMSPVDENTLTTNNSNHQEKENLMVGIEGKPQGLMTTTTVTSRPATALGCPTTTSSLTAGGAGGRRLRSSPSQ